MKSARVKKWEVVEPHSGPGSLPFMNSSFLLVDAETITAAFSRSGLSKHLKSKYVERHPAVWSFLVVVLGLSVLSPLELLKQMITFVIKIQVLLSPG